MKKLLLCSGLLFTCLNSNGQSKNTHTATTENKYAYSLCANVIAAKTITMAGLRHNDVALVQVYMRDANGCAMDAKAMFLKYKDDLLKRKLSENEIEDLRQEIDYFVSVTSNPEEVSQWSDEQLKKSTVMSALLDKSFVDIFNKLMK